jgi:hypothetical protein
MKRPWADTSIPTSGGEYIQLGSGKDATFEHSAAEQKREKEAEAAAKKKAPAPPPPAVKE